MNSTLPETVWSTGGGGGGGVVAVVVVVVVVVSETGQDVQCVWPQSATTMHESQRPIGGKAPGSQDSQRPRSSSPQPSIRHSCE